MRCMIAWADDSQTTLDIQIRGSVGLLDYMPILNDAGGMVTLVNHPVDLIFDLGWSIPYPARGFQSMRKQILSAPFNICAFVVVARNPLTRATMNALLLRPYPDVKAKMRVKNKR
ncbi:MAG: hypothetical protein SGI73_18625 [Chloroflexota bacterium]|nr:hypothetical protein [Chloroflexota bacterium]